MRNTLTINPVSLSGAIRDCCVCRIAAVGIMNNFAFIPAVRLLANIRFRVSCIASALLSCCFAIGSIAIGRPASPSGCTCRCRSGRASCGGFLLPVRIPILPFLSSGSCRLRFAWIVALRCLAGGCFSANPIGRFADRAALS